LTFSKKKTYNFIAIILFLGSCTSDNNTNRLIKISDEEYISLFENYEIPSIDSVQIIDKDGNSISSDSFKNIAEPDKYVLDYYKNSKDVIREGVLRIKTPKDELIIDKIFRISLEPEEAKEIDNLKTIESQNAYLTKLLDEDQSIRDGTESEIMLKFGVNSKEHNQHRTAFIRSDKRVFEKMKYYLESHGYPKDETKYDLKALHAIPVIIGHNSNYKAQKETLDILIDSYKNGYCKKEVLVQILGEMHETKHNGRRYEMKSKIYTTDQEFEELCAVLKIEI